jgi:hypothetical protein
MTPAGCHIPCPVVHALSGEARGAAGYGFHTPTLTATANPLLAGRQIGALPTIQRAAIANARKDRGTPDTATSSPTRPTMRRGSTADPAGSRQHRLHGHKRTRHGYERSMPRL